LEKEYKAGVGSLVRLNEAQRDLTIAQVRLATVQVALRQAWYDLWSATGQIEDKLIP
jgi:outer membrane protein TolC